VNRRIVFSVACVVAGLALAVAPARAQAAGTDSSVTVSGKGEFANLKITVSQTRDLTNQEITISWTGGKPTVDDNIWMDYLQIMQCWGDDPAGPKREQCQFGALYTDARGGTWTGKRQVSYGPGLIDPKETYKPTPPTPTTPAKDAYVPFQSVSGEVAEDAAGGQFFDANTTNEIPYARTRPDGTGEEFFEVQTANEAPGLGCGATGSGGGAATGRPCWLAIVPRGETEVNGTTGDAKPHHFLDSSPLSQTNWDNRIVVPLGFQPLGQNCPIGAAERRTVGHELIAEAVLRWQPTLCANNGPVYGYSQVTDDLARSQLATTNPGMAFLSQPVPPDKVKPDRPLVYAPVAVSGLVIAVNVEQQTQADADPTVKINDGRRITELKLTPKLVAKLLTQSYRAGADVDNQRVADNPFTMVDDKEFRDLNPVLAGDKSLDLPLDDMLVAVGQADVATELWNWILADPAAKAFLAGTPDPPDEHGIRMHVNPVYKALTWPADNYPKADLYCKPLRGEGGEFRDWCTLDMHPYANNMHDTARSASRGDTLVHNAVARDAQGNAIGWKKGTPQPPGKRAVLAVTDAATAARYGLTVASLQNAAGKFMAPTTDSLLAGVATMKAGPVSGVLQPDPQAKSATAYPLTTVTYAATVPSALDSAAGKDYANFLRYAVGAGQNPGVEPGTLPFGYAPMPANLRDQATAAAKTIEDTAGKPVVVPGPGTPPPAPLPAAAPPVAPSAQVAAPVATSAATPAAGPRPSAAPAGGVPPRITATPTRVAVVRYTPAQPVGAVRYALVAILILGGLAAGIGPVLLRLGAGATSGGDDTPPTGL
jgi:hypothetical protein